MSIEVFEDGRRRASFTSREVVEVRVVFEYGEQTWTLRDGHWEVTPGWVATPDGLRSAAHEPHTESADVA